MTINEASEKYQYDVSIYYSNGLWYWDINGGYSSVGGKTGYIDIVECQKELLEFLSTFEPFKK